MGKRAAYRRRWIFAVIGAPLLVLLILMSGLAGWTDLNSWHEDVDITTGRIRRTRYLFHCKVSESIEDSVVSRALAPEAVANARADWRRVNTFCGMNWISPHYAFHGALGDLQTLAQAHSFVTFTNEANERVAEEILQRWQASKNDWEAGEYIVAVLGRAITMHVDEKKRMTAGDLPQVAGKREDAGE